MKKALIRSLITALVINTTGAVINLVSFFIKGRFLLCQVLNGGECVVFRGFGLILKKISPLKPSLDPDAYSTMISPDPGSFVVTIAVCFIPAFVVFSIVYLLSRKKKFISKETRP